MLLMRYEWYQNLIKTKKAVKKTTPAEKPIMAVAGNRVK